MLNLFIFLLLFIVPGLVSVLLYELTCHRKIRCHLRHLSAALIFDLLILVINFAGLYLIKDICTLEKLICSLESLPFIIKYAVLSLIIAAVLGAVLGIICQLYKTKKCYKHKKNTCC